MAASLFSVVYGSGGSDRMLFSDEQKARKKLVLQTFAFINNHSVTQQPVMLEYADDQGVWLGTKYAYIVDLEELSKVPEHLHNTPEAAFHCIGYTQA